MEISIREFFFEEYFFAYELKIHCILAKVVPNFDYKLLLKQKADLYHSFY